MSDAPLRVLQVGMTPYCAGTESFIMNLYRRVDRSVVQFDFLSFERDGVKLAFTDEIERLGGRIFTVPRPKKFRKLGLRLRLERFFREHGNEFQIVHQHINCLSEDFGPIRLAKRHDLIRILHAHNAGSEPRRKRLLRLPRYRDYANKRDVARLADHYFACSEASARFLFGRVDAQIIKNAIDTGRFRFSSEGRAAKRRELGLDDDVFVALFVGRVSYQKNPLFMLDIFSEIAKKRPKSVLLTVGDSRNARAEEEFRAKLAESSSTCDVRRLGMRSDVDEIMRASDAMLLPSRFEGFPVTLVEAQASGLPCFASVEATPESVDLTGLVDRISLERDARFWADRVLARADGAERNDRADDVRAQGYDFEDNCRRVQELYLQFWKDANGRRSVPR